MKTMNTVETTSAIETESPLYEFPTFTQRSDYITIGDFLLSKLPNGNVLISNSYLEAMETDTEQLEAILKKFWRAEF